MLDFFHEHKNVEFLLILKSLTMTAYSFDAKQQAKDSAKNGHVFHISLKSLVDTSLMMHSSNSKQDSGNLEIHGDFPLVVVKKEDSARVPSYEDILSDLRIKYYRPHYGYFAIKRTMDILGAIIGITFFLPIALFVALLIKVTSLGPVLFKQNRVGYKGKLFVFVKFRSMRSNSDKSIHENYVKKLISGQ